MEGLVIADLSPLPPGFRAAAVSDDPFAHVLAGMETIEPGTVLWNDAGARCQAAVMLAPDRVITARTLTAMGLLALYDALAVLAPPQVPIEVGAGDCLLVDGARAAWVQVALGEGDPATWAAIGIAVAMASGIADPGDAPGETWLAEEGFGDVTAPMVVSGFCRHLLAWIEAWRDEGADGLARAVEQRSTGRLVRA